MSLETIYRDHNPWADLTTKPLNLGGKDGKGWTQRKEMWSELVREVRPHLALEVGVSLGGTSATIAKLLQEQGLGGRILSIDTWLGELGSWGDRLTATGGVQLNERQVAQQVAANDAWRRGVPQPSTSATFPSLEWANGYPTIYYHFLSNMAQLGLNDTVIPFPVPSMAAAEFLQSHGILADLMHIDGAHDYLSARNDLAAWWPLLRPGGVLVGDDYAPWTQGVVQAFDEFANEHGVALAARASKAILRKPPTPASANTAFEGLASCTAIRRGQGREAPTACQAGTHFGCKVSGPNLWLWVNLRIQPSCAGVFSCSNGTRGVSVRCGAGMGYALSETARACRCPL